MPGDPGVLGVLIAGAVIGFIVGLLCGFQIGTGRRD